MDTLKDFFGFTQKDKNKSNEFVVSNPTNVVRNIHLIKNPTTGELDGLTEAMYNYLISQFTEKEQSDNPNAGEILYSIEFKN